MNRELVLATLALGLCGGVISLAGWLPGRRGEPAASRLSGRRLERRSWRRLWLPLLPAAVALAVLAGWGLQEPRETDELLHPLIALLVLPVGLIWLRAAARAVLALRAPRLMPPLATQGLLRPRVVVAATLRSQLDDRAFAAALAHERAHVRHRDPLRIWLAQIATDAQWPHPSARRRLDRWLAALEIARDEEARQAGTAGADLAAAVLAVAAMGPAPRVPGLAALTGAEAALRDRVHRLLAPLPDGEIATVARVAVPVILLTSMAAAALAGLEFGDSLLRALPFITS